jgi:hypothetical protein
MIHIFVIKRKTIRLSLPSAASLTVLWALFGTFARQPIPLGAGGDQEIAGA